MFGGQTKIADGKTEDMAVWRRSHRIPVKRSDEVHDELTESPRNRAAAMEVRGPLSRNGK